MFFQDATAKQPSWQRGPETVEEAYSWLKWREEQARVCLQAGTPSDALAHFAHMRDRADQYKLCFPDHRIELGMIAARAERLRTGA